MTRPDPTPTIPDWARDAIVYHLFPLGACAAPRRNDLRSAPSPRLRRLLPWLDHAAGLGATAVLLGPVWESLEHGYDTLDLRAVDRRLGTIDTLRELVDHAHQIGLRVMLDAVFNHVGRDHFVFRDVHARGPESPYCGWISGLRFGPRSPDGDPFVYDTWNGHWNLVKLDTANPEARAWLLDAVSMWVRQVGIDGLRLDAADTLSRSFQRTLVRHCAALRDDLWLMGEVVHGDYNRWAAPGRLHSVTNYELYKALWSSHLDRNFFELTHVLQRQGGLYGDLPLATFADNHDVERLASRLSEPGWLHTAALLLFTLPGIPTIYYGSEWGQPGRKAPDHDWDLRPALDLAGPRAHPELVDTTRRLAGLRRALPALRRGSWRALHVAPQQLSFAREHEGQRIVVMVNAAPGPVAFPCDTGAIDVLNDGSSVAPGPVTVPGCWGRILVDG